MDASSKVIDRGVVYVDGPTIAAVSPAMAPPPPGFEAVEVVQTRGTLFPGLIELHNHLPYDVLRLWQVPQRFPNRGKWGGIPPYGQLITTPMRVLGTEPGLMPAVVRYVECKALLGGVTTSQGIALFSNAGARRFYRGAIRNVEATDNPALPEASTRIADVEAGSAEKFLARLEGRQRLILHLAEGVDATARGHFLSLKVPMKPNETVQRWAINENLVGIHCAGLHARDFRVMASHGGSMVWSPLSNLLLYGATARVKAAKAEGMRIGLGSDWAPSGSKNLLGELKAARVASEFAGGVFSDAELVAMATRNPAAMLGWDAALGSLEQGKLADVVVINGTAGDPYERLLNADEADISLVLINGVAHVGTVGIMEDLGRSGERISVGGRARILHLDPAAADPAVSPIALKAAAELIADALARLPELAARTRALFEAAPEGGGPRWFLALDELSDTGAAMRPRLPLAPGGAPTGPGLEMLAAPLPPIPLELDAITVVDDEDFHERLAAERNLPAGFAAAVTALF